MVEMQSIINKITRVWYRVSEIKLTEFMAPLWSQTGKQYLDNLLYIRDELVPMKRLKYKIWDMQ